MGERTSGTALITGASRGLGLALARALARDGWALVVTARGSEALGGARAQLAAIARHADVVAVAGDVADPAHCDSLAAVARSLGGLDAVVNNASVLGISPRPVLVDYPLGALERVYRTNVFAVLGLLQVLRDSLKPGACIINVTSDVAVEPYAAWGAYGSSKAALEHLSAVFAVENPQFHVYWVDPGDMRTQLHQEAFPGQDISDRPLPEESVPGIIALLDGSRPSGRYHSRAVVEARSALRIP